MDLKVTAAGQGVSHDRDPKLPLLTELTSLGPTVISGEVG